MSALFGIVAGWKGWAYAAAALVCVGTFVTFIVGVKRAGKTEAELEHAERVTRTAQISAKARDSVAREPAPADKLRNEWGTGNG